MKRCVVFGIVLSGLMFGRIAATGASPADGKTIAVVTVGDVEEAVADRATAFLRDNTALHVSPRRSVECKGNTVEAVGECVAKELADHEACLVALVWIDEHPDLQGAQFLEKGVVVVNMRSLKTANASEEVFARRVERQVMQNVGLLLGMNPCPNPQCVLWAYSSLEEMDAKGRNFCPPCLDRLQRNAKEKDVALDAGSPFNMQ